MNIQIFGINKSFDSKKAERFSKYARLVVHTTKKKLFHN